MFNPYTFAIDNQLIKLDKMNKNQLWKILSTLQKTPKNNQKGERLKYLESCTDDEIHAICGACKNFLHNNIKLTQKKKTYLRKKLGSIKDDIRQLSKPQTSIKMKRKILKNDQVSKGVFSLLASVIIPSIVSALAGK